MSDPRGQVTVDHRGAPEGLAAGRGTARHSRARDALASSATPQDAQPLQPGESVTLPFRPAADLLSPPGGAPRADCTLMGADYRERARDPTLTARPSRPEFRPAEPSWLDVPTVRPRPDDRLCEPMLTSCSAATWCWMNRTRTIGWRHRAGAARGGAGDRPPGSSPYAPRPDHGCTTFRRPGRHRSTWPPWQRCRHRAVIAGGQSHRRLRRRRDRRHDRGSWTGWASDMRRRRHLERPAHPPGCQPAGRGGAVELQLRGPGAGWARRSQAGCAYVRIQYR